MAPAGGSGRKPLRIPSWLASDQFELLESMRNSAEDMRGAFENTPTPQDLRRLYERD